MYMYMYAPFIIQSHIPNLKSNHTLDGEIIVMKFVPKDGQTDRQGDSKSNIPPTRVWV